MPPTLLGSITDATPAHRGQTVITGSHGARTVGEFALSIGIAGLIFHDAGVGLEDAGIACLMLFDEAGLPAAAVSHMSARIGDADDMRDRGIISRANRTARDLGIGADSRAIEAAEVFTNAAIAPKNGPPREIIPFARRSVSRSPTVTALDSASMIGPEDIGTIVFTGSHGGLPGGHISRAIKHPVGFTVFNDAGIGIENAGIDRIFALDAMSIPAAAVDCMTARIGDGLSTYETGVISIVNETASALGIESGMVSKEIAGRLPSLTKT